MKVDITGIDNECYEQMIKFCTERFNKYPKPCRGCRYSYKNLVKDGTSATRECVFDNCPNYWPTSYGSNKVDATMQSKMSFDELRKECFDTIVRDMVMLKEKGCTHNSIAVMYGCAGPIVDLILHYYIHQSYALEGSNYGD